MKRSLVALLVALGILSDAVPATAIPNYQQVEICSAVGNAACAQFDGSGNLKVTGGSSTVTFPYNGTNGQTITSASYLGVGGLDAGGHFSPLKQDASQNLDINCITGCGGGSTTFPYAGTNGQTLTAASFLGAGARDANGQFSPLQEDASQNLLAKIVSGSTTAVTQATGTNLHAVLDTTSTTAVTQATASNLNAAVVGTGVAGTPAGGVLSIQGVASGTAIPVSGTFFQSTQPVSCATAATCPVNASQVGGPWTQNLTQIGGTSYALGATTASASAPVTIASNQANFGVNQTTGTAGYGYILDSAGTNVAGVDSSHNQLVSVNAWPLGSTTTLGKVTTLLPYNGSGTGQTTTTNSAVALVGYNGTTSDPIKSTAGAVNAAIQGSNGAITSFATSGGLNTSLCSTSVTNTCTNVSTLGSDGQALGGVNSAATSSLNVSYNGTNWDRVRKDTYAAGPLWVTTGGGSTSFAITAALAGPTVIKASAGRLVSFLVTTAGTTGTETFYDNASACSGNVIGIANGTTLLAGAIAGYLQTLNYTAVNGITACGGTGSPALTVGYF